MSNGLSWWNTDYKRRLQLIAEAAEGAENGISSGYSLKFNPTGTYAAEIYEDCLANGDDLRIVYWDGSSWVELDRDLVTFSESEIEVWFAAQADIAGGESNGDHYAYYGNPDAGSPPTDKSNVYKVWEDFEDGNVDGWVLGVGTSFGIDTSRPYEGNYCGFLTGPTGQQNRAYLDTEIGSDGYVVEAWLYQGRRGGLIWANADTDCNWKLRTYPYTTLYLVINGVSDTASADCDSNEWHHQRVERIPGGNVKVYYDGVLEFDKAQDGSPTQYIGIESDTNYTTAYGYIDNVKVRLLVATEPTVSGGSEEDLSSSAAAPYAFIM